MRATRKQRRFSEPKRVTGKLIAAQAPRNGPEKMNPVITAFVVAMAADAGKRIIAGVWPHIMNTARALMGLVW